MADWKIPSEFANIRVSQTMDDNFDGKEDIKSFHRQDVMPVGRVGIIYFPFISDTANLMINITTTK
jgi:hypothetical protein